MAGRFARLGDRAIVAVDGVDGSGKTVFADELAAAIERSGRPVVRAGVDGFHNPRAIRYRRGRDDPQGYFADSYDYDGLKRHLLEPFRSGAATVETDRFDYRTDRPVTGAQIEPPADALLVFDGIFLHREALRDFWTASVFLDVPFAVSFARMAERDGTDPDPESPSNRRYREGQTLYLATCRPAALATCLIDNADFDAPKLVAGSPT